MRKFSFLLLFLGCMSFNSYSQCFAPSSIYTTNISYYNTEVNWNIISMAHHYKIRYQIVGSGNWQYKNNIDPNINVKIITNLTPLNQYIWQIRTHCDSVNSNTSNWSVADTFYTSTTLYTYPSALNTTNINYNNATANWDTINQVNRYRVHYRATGSAVWLNQTLIYHPNNSIILPLL